MDEQTQVELPKYNCHKQVWALKIKAINEVVENLSEVGASLVFHEKGYAPIEVGDNYLEKHRPEVGGYYVVYKGGYKSYSPADVFEEGYSRA